MKFVAASEGSVPENAFPGGEDASGETIYIGRAMHQGAQIPGKLVPSHGMVYISSGGKEHAKRDYEVLVKDGNTDNLGWVNGNDGLPKGAIQSGHEANGNPLYVGRVLMGIPHMNTIQYQWVVGKVNTETNKCYIPHEGKEFEKNDYEVLCVNNNVIHIVI